MPSYKTLRTAAFQIGPALDEPWSETFHVMEFPEQWKAPLVDLSTEQYG